MFLVISLSFSQPCEWGTSRHTKRLIRPDLSGPCSCLCQCNWALGAETQKHFLFLQHDQMGLGLQHLATDDLSSIYVQTMWKMAIKIMSHWIWGQPLDNSAWSGPNQFLKKTGTLRVWVAELLEDTWIYYIVTKHQTRKSMSRSLGNTKWYKAVGQPKAQYAWRLGRRNPISHRDVGAQKEQARTSETRALVNTCQYLWDWLKQLGFIHIHRARECDITFGIWMHLRSKSVRMESPRAEGIALGFAGLRCFSVVPLHQRKWTIFEFSGSWWWLFCDIVAPCLLTL